MGKVKFHLPGNRGVLHGPELQAVAAEQLRSQAATLASPDGLFIGNMGPATPWAAVAGPTATTSLFSAVFPFIKTVRVKYAQLTITTSPAGSHVQAAIYRLEFTPGPILREIAGTRAYFDGSVSGRQTVSTERVVDVAPDKHLYIGTWRDNAALRLSGVNTTSVLPPIGKLHYDDPGNPVLPSVVSNFHWDDAHDLVGVCFLSEYGKLVY